MEQLTVEISSSSCDFEEATSSLSLDVSSNESCWTKYLDKPVPKVKDMNFGPCTTVKIPVPSLEEASSGAIVGRSNVTFQRHPPRWSTAVMKVVKANSINDFTLEYCFSESSHKKYGHLSKNWFEDMQQFYNDPDNLARYELKTTRLIYGRIYVHKGNDGKWTRVTPETMHDSTGKCHFYCLDEKLMRIINVREVYELHSTFWHAPTTNARLFGILPCNETWSPHSIRCFQNLVLNKEFKCFFPAQPSTLIGGIHMEHIVLEVVLVEKLNDMADLSPMTVQGQLVQMGLAVYLTGLNFGPMSWFESAHSIYCRCGLCKGTLPVILHYLPENIEAMLKESDRFLTGVTS